MREIKFRAWDSDLKKMFYLDKGHFLVCSSGACLYCSEWLDELFVGGFVKNGIHAPKILMQSTGLKANGIEIYEGDIVLVRSLYETDEPIECPAKVFYARGAFRLDFHDMIITNKIVEGDGNWSVERIGNIMQNPELLKQVSLSSPSSKAAGHGCSHETSCPANFFTSEYE